METWLDCLRLVLMQLRRRRPSGSWNGSPTPIFRSVRRCSAPHPRSWRRASLVQRQIRARSAENLAFAVHLLRGSAANVLAVEGGWYITLQLPRWRTEEEWVLALLEDENVLVQPRFFYDFSAEAFLIVSLLTEPPIFRAI